MKKILALLLSFLFCLAFAPPPAVSAASASASLSGPSTVRAGDTITVTFRVNASGVTGFTGEVRYDASQLTLTGAQQKIGNPWMVEFNNTAGVVKFVAYDNALTSPINGTADLFAMTFKVSNVAAGTAVSLSSSGVIASDGAADVNVGNAGYSVTIAEPLSGNTFLSGLTIENAALSPAFNKNTTSYQVQVPYSVSRLSIKATAEDAKSKVTINQPNLTPGGTTKVTITVQAQTGATKAYSISVARAQDPNYKPSGNNDLSSLAVDGFLLSPPFSPDIKSYVVWLPYETESVEISGAAADAKATVQTNGGETLLAG